MIIDGLTRLLGNLEPDRATSLLLAHCCTINRVSVGRNIVDPETHHITPSQFAIDRKIEERKVTRLLGKLQPRSDGPDVLRLRWGLLSHQFILVPMFTLGTDKALFIEYQHDLSPYFVESNQHASIAAMTANQCLVSE